MKLEVLSEYPEALEMTLTGFLDEDEMTQEEYEALKVKTLDVGTRILVVDAQWNPNVLIELDKETTVKCKGFCKGYTSDHWLLFEDGSENVVAVFQEPADYTDQKGSLEDMWAEEPGLTVPTLLERHDANIVLRVM